MADDRAAMDQLGRYWDDLTRGVPSGSADLEPSLVEALQRFHALGSTPPPGAARNRVWREIRAQMDVGPRDKETLMQATATLDHPRITPISNGRIDPRHGRPASQPIPIALRRRVGSAVSLAAAAVLMLALAGGLVAIRFGMPGSNDSSFSSIPAVQVSPEASPPAGPVEFLWETPGDPDSPPWYPAHLVVAPDGNIWVADGENDRFQIVSPDGGRVEVWGESGSGEGQFDFTTEGWAGYDHGAIAFAPDGGFYVADPGNHRIQRFGPDRGFLSAWGSEGREDGQFVTPIDLVVDGQGRVVVLDSSRNSGPAGPGVGAVQVFSADGRFLAKWGEGGTEPGQLSGPFGIALDPHDGTLLICEYDTNRVQRFTPEGAFLHGWGGGGLGDGQFLHAMDAAVDTKGRVFVADFSHNRVQVFDRNGRFVAKWGTYGPNPGEFAAVLGVAVGLDGTVYVTDQGKRLQAFRVGALPEPAASPTP
jgi:DNA-binding beta-propeller fold protein YncE